MIPYNPSSPHVETIEREHYEIHEGNHYKCQDYDDDVDSGVSKFWHVKSPNTSIRVHLCYKIITSKNGLLEFFEDATFSNSGTTLTVFNNNRNSTNTTTTEIFKDPIITASGTRIDVNVLGTDGTGVAGAVGGSSKRTDEIILKSGTSYILKITALSNDTRISSCFSFYEE